MTSNAEHNGALINEPDFDMIAANIVKWNRHQDRAFARRPLAYVDALLWQMAESGRVDIGRIGEALHALLPNLPERECDDLVCLYMSGRAGGD